MQTKPKSKNNSVIVIGAGLAGLSAAAYLAKAGLKVTILEKNNWIGGRAQVWHEKGYTFDMGPTWYWMPDIFEQFYADFGHKTSDFYVLTHLDPSYRIYFPDQIIDLPAGRKKMCELFEKIESGAAEKLNKLLDQTKVVYSLAMNSFVPPSYNSMIDLFSWKLLTASLQIMAQYNGFLSVHSYLKQTFKNNKLIEILEFPIYFLGGPAIEIPSVYCIMNHVDIDLGTWYPYGGFGKVTYAYHQIALDQGVSIILNSENIKINPGKKISVHTCDNQVYAADYLVSTADTAYTDTELLPHNLSNYTQHYWQSRKYAPSALIFYLGLNKQIYGLLHHTLFFHYDRQAHNQALFGKPGWPERPLYYVTCPTKTDKTLAPQNCDVLTVLIPVASGLRDNEEIRSRYFKWIINDLEQKLELKINDTIEVKKIFSINNFQSDYHAYNGNAYGLAQTTGQTAFFRPHNKNRKLHNMYYAGHCTIPGIGLPMVTLSGKIAAGEIMKDYAAANN